jgi:hypothetical protein
LEWLWLAWLHHPQPARLLLSLEASYLVPLVGLWHLLASACGGEKLRIVGLWIPCEMYRYIAKYSSPLERERVKRNTEELLSKMKTMIWRRSRLNLTPRKR